MLIHQPFNDYYGIYRAMVDFYKEGRIKALGVSNFYPDRIVDFCKFQEIKPAVNQVETHPFYQQKYANEIMKKYGVQIESWGPFAEGKKDMFTNPVLSQIGSKYNKSIAQTILRFLIQKGIVVIPKTVSIERMRENFNVFDFKLSQDDMTKIEALDENDSAFFSHTDPEMVEFLANWSK